MGGLALTTGTGHLTLLAFVLCTFPLGICDWFLLEFTRQRCSTGITVWG